MSPVVVQFLTPSFLLVCMPPTPPFTFTCSLLIMLSLQWGCLFTCNRAVKIYHNKKDLKMLNKAIKAVSVVALTIASMSASAASVTFQKSTPLGTFESSSHNVSIPDGTVVTVTIKPTCHYSDALCWSAGEVRSGGEYVNARSIRIVEGIGASPVVYSEYNGQVSQVIVSNGTVSVELESNAANPIVTLSW